MKTESMKTNLWRWLLLTILNLGEHARDSLLLIVLVGALFVSLLTELFASFGAWIAEQIGLPGWLGITLIVIVVAVVLTLSFRRYQQTALVEMRVSDRSSVPRSRHVLTALSPYQTFKDGDNLQVVRDLVDYHAKDGDLRTLHLVCALHRQPDGSIEPANPDSSPHQGVKTAYGKLQEYLRQRGLQIDLIVYTIEQDNSPEAIYEVAERVLASLQNNEQASSHLMVDVTAGSKLFTTALAVAAFTHGFPVTYLETVRDAEGKPIPNAAPKPILFDSKRMLRQLVQ
jgi:hypothetical protein